MGSKLGPREQQWSYYLKLPSYRRLCLLVRVINSSHRNQSQVLVQDKGYICELAHESNDQKNSMPRRYQLLKLEHVVRRECPQ